MVWFNILLPGFIDTIEKNSGVTFTQAQVALARQWVAGDTLTTQKEIVLGVPQKGDVFVVDKKDSDKLKAQPVTIKEVIPTDDEAALQTLEAFQNGSYGLQEEAVSDNVAQHMLNANSSLFDEPWVGTEEEELNSWVLLNISILIIAKDMALSVIYLSWFIFTRKLWSWMIEKWLWVYLCLCIYFLSNN